MVKIHQDNSYNPITITLESSEEALAVTEALEKVFDGKANSDRVETLFRSIEEFLSTEAYVPISTPEIKLPTLAEIRAYRVQGFGCSGTVEHFAGTNEGWERYSCRGMGCDSNECIRLMQRYIKDKLEAKTNADS